jgi:class 3 adenylate cyclase
MLNGCPRAGFVKMKINLKFGMLNMNLEALTEFDETEIIVGFFNLMGYARWSEGKPPRDILNLASALLNRAGRAIAGSDGVLVKAIGDAGLFVFPADNPERAVLALEEIKRDCDSWLSECGYPDIMSVTIQVGSVAVGRVGPPEDERLDVYGATVNRAAMMQGRAFSVGETLYDRLQSKSKSRFTRFNDDEFILSD